MQKFLKILNISSCEPVQAGSKTPQARIKIQLNNGVKAVKLFQGITMG